MDTALLFTEYEDQIPVWQGSGGQEFSADCVVPDTMPDVGQIIDAEGVLILRSRDTQDGAVRLSASVSVSVLYMPEGENRLLSLEMTVPAELTLDAPGTDGDCRTAVRLRLRAVEARTVNSRKLTVRADVGAEAVCYARRRLRIAGGVEGKEPVHIRTGTAAVESVTDVREKTFVVTDEFSLPAGDSGMDRIISRSVETVVEDARYVSGKAVFRGRIRTGLVFSSAAGDTVSAGRYETEFSQLMEVDADTDEGEPEIFISLTGAYFDMPGNGGDHPRVGAELHFAAQCVSRCQRELSYVEDIYSNRTCLTAQTEAYAMTERSYRVSQRQTVTGVAEPVCTGDVVSTSVSVGSVGTDGQNVRAGISIRLVTRDEAGRYNTSRCRLTAVFTPDTPPEAELSSVCVSASEAYYSPGEMGMEVRASVTMTALASVPCRLVCVSELEEDAQAWQEQRQSLASVSLVRVPEGADPWSLAKRYHSDTEVIAAVNQGKTEGLLLIPMTR